MNLRILHRTSAIVIGVFACVHIANHLTALSSVTSHIAFMDAARLIYRQPIVELAILFCVAFQIGSGFWFVVRGWKERRGLIPWLQALSGAYLALFFMVHVGAVLIGRTWLDLDTNFYFAAAGFHVPPYQYFFAPYYFLAVPALFTHLGCAAYWQIDSDSRTLKALVVAAPMFIGGLISLLIVLSLAGTLRPVDIPEKYKVTYMRDGR